MRGQCPSEADLLAFDQGTLPAGAIEAVADHLETCSSCEAALGRLDRGGDPVLALLRKTIPADPTLVLGGPPEVPRLRRQRIDGRSCPATRCLSTSAVAAWALSTWPDSCA